MNDIEQLFQERLEQLEAGESPEACLEGLPEEETKALRLIAAIRTLSVDDADEESIVAQRSEILGAASTRLNGKTAPTLGTLALPFWEQLKAWLQRFLANRELVIGFASLLIIVILGLAFRGNTWQLKTDETGTVASVRDEDDDRESDNDIETAANDNAESEAETATETNANAPAIADGPGPTLYIPVVTAPLNLSPETAVIDNVQGIVEIQTDSDTWTTVNSATTIAAGQRVRTGKLSQATLSFYDGSQAHLSADTEISIDELNALRPEAGFRTVVLTQWVGDSEHSVQFRNDGGSLYEVKTPEGSGIARGTKFHVIVEPNSLAQYIVTEGKVDVSGHSRTVSVTAGQLTTLLIGTAPADPVFNISGEGEVTAVGDVWTIAGQTFQTYEQTIIVGNPQVGDLVQVFGHLLPDGSRVADRIILIRRAVVNQFNLTGEVEAMGATWTIARQAILVNDQTAVDDDISVGDSVRVEGIILPDGVLQAQVITRLEEAPGLPFQFSGIVEAINDRSWIISGQTISVNEETAVDNGIVVGDVVAVSGWILEDNAWLADEISKLSDELPTFEFTGTVQSMDPWLVAGISFETRSWTVIVPTIDLGDQVRVSGTILADGTWVADTITSLADIQPDTVSFIGVVASVNPWVVNGLTLVTTSNTVITGNIAVGTLVVVQAQLLPDGTWTVLQIRPLYPTFGFGCLVLSSPVVAVNANTIQVRHWQGNIDRVHIQGDVAPNHVVTLPICTGWDGTIVITGTIIVIYQPVVVIIDDGGWVPPGGIPPGCKITGIGNNNPHLKCSGGSSRQSSRRS